MIRALAAGLQEYMRTALAGKPRTQGRKIDVGADSG